MLIPANPDYLETVRRLADAEREVDAAREHCRKLLHTLTDARITLAAATDALRDADDVAPEQMGGAR